MIKFDRERTTCQFGMVKSGCGRLPRLEQFDIGVTGGRGFPNVSGVLLSHQKMRTDYTVSLLYTYDRKIRVVHDRKRTSHGLAEAETTNSL